MQGTDCFLSRPEIILTKHINRHIVHFTNESCEFCRSSILCNWRGCYMLSRSSCSSAWWPAASQSLLAAWALMHCSPWAASCWLLLCLLLLEWSGLPYQASSFKQPMSQSVHVVPACVPACLTACLLVAGSVSISCQCVL